MQKRWKVRAGTALVLAALGTLAYAVGDVNGRSITGGTITAANELIGARTGMTFNFLPAVQRGDLGIFHVDLVPAVNVYERLDVYSKVDPPDPDSPPPLRIFLQDPPDPVKPTGAELHFFNAGAFDIFIVEADGSVVPAEVCPKTTPPR